MPILETLAPIAANAALGLALGPHNDRRQIKQQQKLTDMQLAADKNMSSFQKDMQMQMWLDTNYSAQKEQMIKAGLNPGLLYGMSGGGGVTTGAGAASSKGASAAGTTNEIMGMMQISAMQSQIELTKAQTEKTKAETVKTSGVDTANVEADTENKVLQKIVHDFTGREMKDQYELIKSPTRGVEAKTYQDELEARQGIASNIYELWKDGKLMDKSNAELEQILLSNAKTRGETKNILKSFDLLEENIKGTQLTNALKEYENKMQQETGVAPNASGFIKLIGWLMKSIFGGGK